MKEFYANLFDKGLTSSEALRQAQLKLSKTSTFKSPFYWGGIYGSGRFPAPDSVFGQLFSLPDPGVNRHFDFWADLVEESFKTSSDPKKIIIIFRSVGESDLIFTWS